MFQITHKLTSDEVAEFDIGEAGQSHSIRPCSLLANPAQG